jgi:hypothetical protein
MLLRVINSRSGAWRSGMALNHLQLTSCKACRAVPMLLRLPIDACCVCIAANPAAAPVPQAGLLLLRQSWARLCSRDNCRCLILTMRLGTTAGCAIGWPYHTFFCVLLSGS